MIVFINDILKSEKGVKLNDAVIASKLDEVKDLVEYIKSENKKPFTVRDLNGISKIKLELISKFEGEIISQQEDVSAADKFMRNQERGRVQLRELLLLLDISKLQESVNDMQTIRDECRLNSQLEFEGEKVAYISRLLRQIQASLSDPHLKRGAR